MLRPEINIKYNVKIHIFKEFKVLDNLGNKEEYADRQTNIRLEIAVLSPNFRLASFLKPISKDIGITSGLSTLPIHSPSINASDEIRESLYEDLN